MLTITHKRGKLDPRLPHLVFIDGQYVATMNSDRLRVEIPPGVYTLRVQFGGQVPIGKKGKTLDLSLSSAKQIEVPAHGDLDISFQDRERLWNILFDIDLVAWLVSLFVTMPTIYKIVSDAFFAVWLIRLVAIRKRYYKIILKKGIAAAV